jgi:hypothetical protein
MWQASEHARGLKNSVSSGIAISDSDSETRLQRNDKQLEIETGPIAPDDFWYPDHD